MWKSLRNMRIRNKLFWAYSIAFILAFTVAGTAIYSQVRAIIQSGIDKELVRTTKTITSMVRTNASVSIKNYLRAVAEKNLDVARHFHLQAQRGLMTQEEAKQRAKDAFLSQVIGKTGFVYCLDSDGIMVVHPKHSLLDVDTSGLAFAQQQMKQKEGYLEYEWRELFEPEPRTKAIFMAYFEPWDWIISASTYTEEFSSLINIKDFRQRIIELGFGESGYPFVIDYDGMMLIHPFLEGKHYTEYGDDYLSSIAERIIREKNGKFDYDWRNPGEEKHRKKVVYFSDIPELGWVVASSSYYEDFYGPLDAIGLVIIVSVVVLIMLMVPISMLIGSVITSPLKRLQRRFAVAADGDFSVRMDDSSKDEIGLLAGYFNFFMERLTTYSDSLQAEIAERKKVEKELIAHDRAKTLFLSSASHELRTPLTSIIGFLSLMEKGFTKHFRPVLDQHPDVTRKVERFTENLDVVRSESDRLGRLVNDLLDINKIESGRMEWRSEPLDVNSVLDRAAEAISGYAVKAEGVRFVVEEPSAPMTINADADRIHQVLINLLSNAFKHTDTGQVALLTTEELDRIRFSVCDTGSGIPEDELENVFDIFYQVRDENNRSSKTFGTGLGLTISSQIVAHYGSRLEVESTLGKGSCFSFTLPVER